MYHTCTIQLLYFFISDAHLEQKVDDFYTYGNVDELPKYMKKAQSLNTKLELCKEKIEQVIVQIESHYLK